MAIFERVYTPPAAARDPRVIVSPLSLGVTGEDNIRLSIASCFDSDVVATLHLRFLNEDGTIDSWAQRYTVSASRALESATWRLGVGYILNVSALIEGSQPKVGQCWGKIDIVRGLTGGTISLGTIAGGYLTSGQPLTWPGSIFQPTTSVEGYMAKFNMGGVAPGSPALFIVPSGVHWSLIGAQCSLLTNATALNRAPSITVQPSFIAYEYFHPSFQNASTLKAYYWAAGLTGNINTGLVPTAALPTRTELDAGERVLISSTNLQPGDQFMTANVVVMQRLEVE